MPITKDERAYERQQLLAHWTKRLNSSTDRCWIRDPLPQITRLMTAEAKAIPSQLRQLHDRWGYCAKGRVDTGGLCAGAIYRSAAFMRIPQKDRSGQKTVVGRHGDARTVHMEHTVPVSVLAHQIRRLPQDVQADPAGMLAWLLRHSVTCAFAKEQEAFSKGFTQGTNAFNSAQPEEFGRPFARYNHLKTGPIEVWNVWTGEKIDGDSFHFDDHMATVFDLLKKADASQACLDMLGRSS